MVARRRAGQRTQVSSSSGGCNVSSAAVLQAVESLYDDELKPVSRILRKRIVERSFVETAGCAQQLPPGEFHQEIDVNQLQELCHLSQDLVVEKDDGGDWAALLVDRPESFIDVYKEEDQYPEELWSAFSAYCNSEFSGTQDLPGGRYACALALKSADLPALSSKSLGQICHIVQLALSKRKLLGYSSGSIVPYHRSQSMVKEQCALNRAPCSQAPMIVVTWELARKYLWDLLVREPSGQLPLPNVKRLFRSCFHVELSETAFGYSKVSDLLQDENFKDICEVQLRGQGYVVVSKMPRSSPNVISLFQSLSPQQSFTTAVADVAPRRVELCEPLETEKVDFLDEHVPVCLIQTPTPGVFGQAATWCLTPSTCLELSQDGYKGIVKNSFIQIKHPVTPGLPTSRSMPALSVFDADPDHMSNALSRSDESTTDSQDSDRESDSSSPYEQRSLLPVDPLAELLKEATECSPLHGVIVTPRRSILRTPGEKKTIYRVNFCLEEPLHDTDCDPVAQTPKVLFPDTPFVSFPASPETTEGLDVEKQVGSGSPKLTRAPSLPEVELPNLLWHPGSFSKQGFVRNTFLHAQRCPPTPYVKQEQRRSKSLGAAM